MIAIARLCGLVLLGKMAIAGAVWASPAPPNPSAADTEPQPQTPAAATTAATAAASDLAGAVLFSSPGDGSGVWDWAAEQVAQGDPPRAGAPLVAQPDSPGAAPTSPWRVELRPYLEVPFSISGQLRFESVLDLGNIDIAVAGSGVERLTVTANRGGGLSQGQRATLAAARSALASSGAAGFRSVQLRQTRGVDWGSVFLLGGEIEVWHNDLVLALDGFYATLGTPLQFAPAGAGATANTLELGVDYTRIGAALGWRVGRFPLGAAAVAGQGFPMATVDVLGGARYSAYGFNFASPTSQLTARVNPSWIEPILSTRAEVVFNPRTKLTADAYVGGFGLGAAPSLSWGGSAGLDWQFFPNVAVRPSYRFASVDWGRNGEIVNLTTHSLYLGLTVYFN